MITFRLMSNNKNIKGSHTCRKWILRQSQVFPVRVDPDDAVGPGVLGRPGARGPIEAGDPPSVAQVRSFLTQRTVLIRSGETDSWWGGITWIKPPFFCGISHDWKSREAIFVVKGATSKVVRVRYHRVDRERLFHHAMGKYRSSQYLLLWDDCRLE